MAALDVVAARAAWEKIGPLTDAPFMDILDYADEWVPKFLEHIEQLHRSIRRAMCDPAVIHPSYLATILDEITT